MQAKACLLIHQCVPRLHLKLLHVMSATATLDQTDSRSSAFGRFHPPWIRKLMSSLVSRGEPPLVYIIGFGKLAEALSGYLTPADLHQLQAVHWWIASDLRWYVLGPPTPAIMVQTRGS